MFMYGHSTLYKMFIIQLCTCVPCLCTILLLTRLRRGAWTPLIRIHSDLAQFHPDSPALFKQRRRLPNPASTPEWRLSGGKATPKCYRNRNHTIFDNITPSITPYHNNISHLTITRNQKNFFGNLLKFRPRRSATDR